MSAKEDGNLSGLSLVSDIQSKKKPSECLNHRSFLLSSNKIDSRVDNIMNQKPSAMRNSLDTIGNTDFQ